MALRKSQLTFQKFAKRILFAVILISISSGSLASDAPTELILQPTPETSPTPQQFKESQDPLPSPRPKLLRERSPEEEQRKGRDPRFFQRLPRHVRERLESLPPDQREEFHRNMQRWSELPPSERERLRKRHQEQIEAAIKEMESLIRESGVALDDNQREKFKRYYISERRDLELALMREMAQRRKERLEELRGKLLETLRDGTIPEIPPSAAKRRDEPAAGPPPPPLPPLNQ